MAGGGPRPRPTRIPRPTPIRAACPAGGVGDRAAQPAGLRAAHALGIGAAGDPDAAARDRGAAASHPAVPAAQGRRQARHAPDHAAGHPHRRRADRDRAAGGAGPAAAARRAVRHLRLDGALRAGDPAADVRRLPRHGRVRRGRLRVLRPDQGCRPAADGGLHVRDPADPADAVPGGRDPGVDAGPGRPGRPRLGGRDQDRGGAAGVQRPRRHPRHGPRRRRADHLHGWETGDPAPGRRADGTAAPGRLPDRVGEPDAERPVPAGGRGHGRRLALLRRGGQRAQLRIAGRTAGRAVGRPGCVTPARRSPVRR